MNQAVERHWLLEEGVETSAMSFSLAACSTCALDSSSRSGDQNTIPERLNTYPHGLWRVAVSEFVTIDHPDGTGSGAFRTDDNLLCQGGFFRKTGQ